MTVRELLEQFTDHFVKCKACKIAQACPEGVRLRRIYDDAFEARQLRDMGDRAITKAPAAPAPAPGPYQLWKQAGGDRDKYMALLVEHGMAVVREPLSLWVITFNGGSQYALQRQPIDEKLPHHTPVVVESLEEARGRVPESHTKMLPEAGDNPDIVESWVPNELL